MNYLLLFVTIFFFDDVLSLFCFVNIYWHCGSIRTLLNKEYECVVRQFFSRCSQPDYGYKGKQNGVSNWEMAETDKVSLWKVVTLLEVIYCM